MKYNRPILPITLSKQNIWTAIKDKRRLLVLADTRLAL
jgi:hypothetical protein